LRIGLLSPSPLPIFHLKSCSEISKLRTDLRSKELQLEHALLKVTALITREQAERQEKENLQYALAVAEENNLLSEVYCHFLHILISCLLLQATLEIG